MKREDVIEKLKTGELVCADVKKNSDVWFIFQHLKFKNSDDLIPFVKCRKCDTVFNHDKRSSTSNLKRHKCTKIFNSEKELDGSEPPKKKLKPCPDSVKKECINKLVSLCSKDLRPFNIASGNGFRDFVKFTLNTGAILGTSGVSELDLDDFLPHPTTVSRNTETICENERTKLCSKIRNLIEDGLCSATTDIWTEEHRQTSYITFTIHYMDTEWSLNSCVLFTKSFEIDEKKTGDNILKIFQHQFDKLNLSSESLKKIIFVTDRGSNILNFLRTLKCVHFNCNAHLLNNILKTTFDDKFLTDNLPKVNLLISVCKKLVAYMKKSGDVKKLKNTLNQECPTRWNTCWKMLDSIDRNFNEISALYKNTSKQSIVDSIDIELLRKITTFLKPFKIATDKLESDTKTTFPFVPFILENLKESLTSYISPDAAFDHSGNDEDSDAEEDFTETMKKLATRALNTFEDLIQIDDYHNAAAFLHPKYNKLNWLRNDDKIRVKNFVMKFISKINGTNESSSSDDSFSNTVEDDYASFANTPTVKPGQAEYKLYKQEQWTEEPLLEFWKKKRIPLSEIKPTCQEIIRHPSIKCIQ